MPSATYTTQSAESRSTTSPSRSSAEGAIVSDLLPVAGGGSHPAETARAAEVAAERSALAGNDPLSGAYFASCAGDRREFTAVLSPGADQSTVAIGPGLRGVLRSAPDAPGPVIGVHNPTAAAHEFAVDAHFPDVVAGSAQLVFLGGDVETVGAAAGDVPRLRLRPGAHVWLAQRPDPASAGPARQGRSAAREQGAYGS